MSYIFLYVPMAICLLGYGTPYMPFLPVPCVPVGQPKCVCSTIDTNTMLKMHGSDTIFDPLCCPIIGSSNKGGNLQ